MTSRSQTPFLRFSTSASHSKHFRTQYSNVTSLPLTLPITIPAAYLGMTSWSSSIQVSIVSFADKCKQLTKHVKFLCSIASHVAVKSLWATWVLVDPFGKVHHDTVYRYP